uniref:Annexin n=1 Tax=Anabas testudineus TaxID=64144 RepID=A0A7N6BGD5_ANATE
CSTITDAANFDPSVDAETLYNAMKGIGSDKEAILDLITSRSNAQRQEIITAYKSSFGQDLIEDLKYELTGKFERLIVSLMRTPAYHDAKEIHDGVGTNERCLIEVLASRNNRQIHEMVAAYKDAYGRDMEEDVIGDTSGHFKKMLVVLLQGTRDESGVVDADLVQQDAQDLYSAGEEQWGTDEAKFIMILGNRSVTHLHLVFEAYEAIAEMSIEDSIKHELSGDFERLMLAVVQCIRSVPMFFARRLYKSMKGLGTADNTLIRIMISRSEIDMLDIRECFRLRYEKSLYNMIKDDTSGDYKRTLLNLCGGDDDLAGEFFPEAAQIAYKMWELSAMTKVQVWLRPTVRPASNFDPAADAQALRKAMKGFGTDEDAIIDIVANRSNAQRQEIRKAFKSLLGRDLMKDLKSELSKNLERLIIGLMLTPAEFDAKMMRKAMEGAGTDEHALIEILATRSNEQIHAMNAAYQSAYKTSLEEAIQSDTSGHFCRILVSLVQGAREEGPADVERANTDAQVIYSCNADSDDMEMKFMSILCTRSFPHLRKVFQEFVRCSNKDIEQIIKKEMSGDVKNSFYAIVRSVKNQPSYFADRLYKAMKGLGTDDRALIRIMVSRSEVDLFNIRKEFKETYDSSLHEFIQVETMIVSLSLRLLALIVGLLRSLLICLSWLLPWLCLMALEVCV